MEYWLIELWHWMNEQPRLAWLVRIVRRLEPWWRREKLRDRSISYTTTVVLHLIAFVVLISVEPFRERDARVSSHGGGGGVIGVQIFTLSGLQAETDAPLNEPLLADRSQSQEGTGDLEGVEGRGDDALGDQANGTDSGTETPAVIEPETITSEEEPENNQPELTPETLPDIPETSSDARLLTAPGSGNDPLPALPPDPLQTERPIQTGQGQARTTQPPNPDAPVITTQVEMPGPGEEEELPSFDDILARAEQQFDPADFQIFARTYAEIQTVRDSYCLSSIQTLLEAGDCPEEPNPETPRLAQYGLTELGEVPPVFLEDMDRLAFQLRQLGADPSLIDRLLVAHREAMRSARARDPLLRSMERNQVDQTDHLGVNNPYDTDPARAGPGPGG